MRKIIYYILIAFTAISCSSEKASSDQSEIFGKWNWIESSGGIDGRTMTPQSTGTVIKLEISPTKVFKYVDGILKSENNYSIQTGTSIFGGQRTIMVYENEFKQSIELSDRHLILNEECHDCFQNKYVRE